MLIMNNQRPSKSNRLLNNINKKDRSVYFIVMVMLWFGLQKDRNTVWKWQRRLKKDKHIKNDKDWIYDKLNKMTKDRRKQKKEIYGKEEVGSNTDNVRGSQHSVFSYNHWQIKISHPWLAVYQEFGTLKSRINLEHYWKIKISRTS